MSDIFVDGIPSTNLITGAGPGGSTLVQILGGSPAGAQTGEPLKLHAIEGGREGSTPLEEAHAMSRRVRLERVK